MGKLIEGIVKEKQEKDNYCYASVLNAIVKHYNKNSTIKQQDICDYYIRSVHNATQGTPAKDGSFKQDPIHYLKDFGMYANTIEFNGVIPVDIIIKEIGEFRPVIMLVAEHYVMIYGYEGDAPTGRSSRSAAKQINIKFLIYDPYKPTENKTLNWNETQYDSDEIKGFYLTKSPPEMPGGKRRKTNKTRRTNRTRRTNKIRRTDKRKHHKRS